MRDGEEKGLGVGRDGAVRRVRLLVVGRARVGLVVGRDGEWGLVADEESAGGGEMSKTVDEIRLSLRLEEESLAIMLRQIEFKQGRINGLRHAIDIVERNEPKPSRDIG